MNEVSGDGGPDECTANCRAVLTVEELNRTCYCLTLNEPSCVKRLRPNLVRADSPRLWSRPTRICSPPFPCLCPRRTWTRWRAWWML